MTRWYLFNYKGLSNKAREPMGEVAAVTERLNKAFLGLEWKSARNAECPTEDFTVELGVSGAPFTA